MTDQTHEPEPLSDLRITTFQPLPSPKQMLADLPLDDGHAAVVQRARRQIQAILAGEDDRLMVVVGPCSVHDPDAAREYARRLAPVADALRDDLHVVMRVYFEKPRTRLGWKGLINDPGLDGTFDVLRGLRLA